MISKITLSGFFVDNETAKEIADFLEEYNTILNSRLNGESDEHKKNNMVVDSINIEEICEIFRDEKNEN